MSRGKYLSLEEAIKLSKLDQFCKEHASVGDEREFDRMLQAMASNKHAKNLTEGEQTSSLD